jgi:hypothetical protein
MSSTASLVDLKLTRSLADFLRSNDVVWGETWEETKGIIKRQIMETQGKGEQGMT